MRVKNPKFFVIKIVSILILCCTAFVTSSCIANANQNAQTSEFLQITDLNGRKVQIKTPVNKICCISPNACEILYSIGAGNKVVARGPFCDFPQEATALPDMGAGESLGVEAIAAMQPDLVILNKTGHTLSQVSALENAGLPVMSDDVNSLDELWRYIDLIGQVSNCEDKASELKEQISKNLEFSIESIKRKLGDNNKLFIEVADLSKGLWTSGNQTLLHEMLIKAGFENIFSDINGWGEVSAEQVLTRNPDYIIAVVDSGVSSDSVKDEICKRPEWQNINAIKNNKILAIDSSLMTRPGPRISDYLAKIDESISEN